jgi:hypothetical protein
MKTLKRNLLILLIVSNCYYTTGQEKTPDDIVKNFFNLYKSKSINESFNYLFSTNNLIPNEDVQNIKNQVSKYSSVLGNYYGKETFSKEKINLSIEVHSYVLKYERQPVRFILTFYKPNKKWKIQNFKISDGFIEELEKGVIELKYKN